MSPYRRQRGYLLITVVVTLFLLGTIATLLAYDSANNARTASDALEAARADYVGRAAMQNALWRAGNNACMGDVTIPSTPLGNDSYDATITGASAGNLVVLAADQDAWIRSDDPTRNNGTTLSNHVRFEAGTVEQVLTRFDVSSIATNAQINSAIAWFHLKAGKSHPEGAITVHEVTADWGETTVTWDSLNGAYRAGNIGAIPAQDAGDTWVAINVTGLVQAWVNGQPNHGILFNSTAEGLHTEYTAREDGTNPPRLEVVVGSGAASPVTIKAKGQLANGVGRNLKDKTAPAWQPASQTMLQPGASGVEDAWITSGQTDWNYGAFAALRVQPNVQRSFLRIDLQGHVPIRARVTKATLQLWTTQVISADAIDVHRVARPWEEGSCFGNCGPNDGITWDTYDGANAWHKPGGDVDAAAVSTATPTSTDAWLSWDVTDVAAAWAANPSTNFGVLIEGNPGSAVFASSDDADPKLHPRLTIEYACECGRSCMIQQGSGNVLLVVANPASLLGVEEYKKSLIESWGYTVTLLDDDASQATYDTEVAANDVVYISASVSSGAVGNKLTGASIGVVNEEGALDDELGFSSTQVVPVPVGDSLDITDNSHYITGIFPTGPLQIYTADMGGHAASGTLAPGLQGLANWETSPGLAIIDRGGALGGGATGNAAGRRVLVPFGQDNTHNWSKLNNNGRLIMQRTLDWAMGTTETTTRLPIAHWKLDETNGTVAVDSIGGNDGNLNGNAKWSTGAIGGGLAVDYADGEDYVEVPNSPALENVQEGDYTLAAWFRPDSTPPGSGADNDANYGILIKAGWHTGLYYTNANQFALDQVFDGNSSIGILSGNTFSPGSFHHVAGVVDRSSGTMSLYVNGQLEDTQSFTPGTAAREYGTEPWRIGIAYSGASSWGWAAAGAVDDVRIYDIALSAAEIAALAAPPSGTEVVYVVSDAASPSVQEEYRQKFMIDWGFAVSLLDDNATETEFATLLQGSNPPDVIYVSQEVSPTTVTIKLGGTTIGIVNESRDLLDDFGFASTVPNLGGGMPPMSVDTTHYITSTLTNPVSAFGVNEWYQIVNLPVASGVQPVGTWIDTPYSGRPALMAIATGGQLIGGTPSPSRRVQLPMASGQGATPVNINGLTADGRTIIRRSIEWAAGEGADTGGGSGGGGGGGAAYTELYEPFSATSGNSWQTVNLSSYGVPANAVVELAMENSNTSREREAGVRAVGSPMIRTFDLHEAESGGVDAVTAHVQSDSSSRVQVLAENTGDITFRVLGYWTAASYTELAGLVTANSSGFWQSRDLAPYGVSPGQIVEIVIQNTSGSSEQRAGVRKTGSSLNRIVNVHEAESGGKDYVTMFVEASADANASIEVYAQNSTSVEFKIVGGWDSPPGTYVEAGGIVTSASQANAWHSLNAAASGVPGNAILQIALANDTSSTERQMGVRSMSSSLNRVIDLQEGESGGADAATLHVGLDSSAQFQLYVESSTAELYFYPLGWWIPN